MNSFILPNGYCLYWEDNEVGGRTYYSDEIGGGCFVWDTCLCRSETLLAAMMIEKILNSRRSDGKHLQKSQ